MKPLVILFLLLSSPGLAADLPPPPQPQQLPQQAATDQIARQIGWLIIENANLRAQIDDLEKQLKLYRPGDSNK